MCLRDSSENCMIGTYIRDANGIINIGIQTKVIECTLLNRILKEKHSHIRCFININEKVILIIFYSKQAYDVSTEIGFKKHLIHEKQQIMLTNFVYT